MNLPTYNPWNHDEIGWGFHITSGDYEGVIIKINEIKLDEKIEHNVVVDFEVVSGNEGHEEGFENKDHFQDTFTLIINDVLSKAIEFDKHDKNRANDT